LVLTLPFQFEDILLGVGEKHLEEIDLTCKVHVQVKPIELPLPLNGFVIKLIIGKFVYLMVFLSLKIFYVPNIKYSQNT
jgi:hypothetical protein